METQQTLEETQTVFVRADHPWLMVQDDNLDDDIRYSLDEIRFA